MDPYAEFAGSPLLRRVHGPDYLNVGWRANRVTGRWREPAVGAADPSTVLVDRLLAWGPARTGVVLDVACGRGAAAARVRRRWAHARVVALDRSAAMLPRVVTGSGRWLVRGDATRLPIRDGVADLVLCVEAALHFAGRCAFFREAARVLRPGGRLVVTDLLVDPAWPGWADLVPAENDQRTTADYADSLRGAGLAVVHCRDVTNWTWHPYSAALVAAADEISPSAAAAVRGLLGARPVHGYVEAVAER